MSTELTVINNTLPPANIEEPEEDNGNWGDDEPAKPSYIQIKQPTTDGLDSVANGDFVHKASGQTWKKVNMIILSMHDTRAWKPSAPAFVAGEKALCVSHDGKVPVTTSDYLVPQAPFCEGCSKNSWEGYDRKTKQGPKPLCTYSFYILFLDEETNLPYILTVNGGSATSARAMKEALRQRSKVVKARTGRMPNTYDYVVTMTTEKVGKYYNAKFTDVRQLTKEDAAKFGPLFDQFVKSRKTKPAPEPEVEDNVAEGEYEDSGI